MRSLLFAGGGRKVHSEFALLCCECSLCSLYSCPEGLNPREVCVSAKSDLREMKVNFRNSALNTGAAPVPHPVRDERKVPVSKLVKRLGLAEYNADAPYLEHGYKPARVRIQLSQHIGVPCSPKVAVGQKVAKGEAVGDLPADKLGCPVHASIAGKISRINDRYIEIEA
ncbi:MAG: hypothetical protein A3J79_01110 [Elusimicrobia bacterium RIFOXYB2_FULL_62_6]|nr:MAG: hypothetical protein A3J79_01110 [Elusimicrobia bacterium RIFOXYB2_FULL_62_6]